jgi:hypothetical protein
LSRDEELASEVEHLLGVPSDVLEGVEPISPEPEIPLVALEDRLQIGGHQLGAGAIFAAGIPTQKHHLEVTTVRCRVCPSHEACEHQAPKPRSRREPHEAVGDQTVEHGEENEEALVETATLAGPLTESRERYSSPAHNLGVLLRHRTAHARPRRRRRQPNDIWLLGLADLRALHSQVRGFDVEGGASPTSTRA